MESVVHTLARCRDWKVFATLTWSKAQPPTSAGQRKLLFAHHYRMARTLRIPFRRLLWVVRQELGEKFNRPHYHVLYGWRGEKATVGLCFTANSLWQATHADCGFARHFVYDAGQDAVGYITKVLSGSARDTVSASNYEAGKFGWSVNEVTLSEALLRVISRSNRRLGGETLTGHSGKSADEKCDGCSENVCAKTNRELVRIPRSWDDRSSIVYRSGNWAKRR